MKIDYPESIKPTDLDQFCAVFAQLVQDKVKSVVYNKICGVVTIYFNDGTSCGSAVPWIRAGALSESDLKLK